MPWLPTNTTAHPPLTPHQYQHNAHVPSTGQDQTTPILIASKGPPGNYYLLLLLLLPLPVLLLLPRSWA